MLFGCAAIYSSRVHGSFHRSSWKSQLPYDSSESQTAALFGCNIPKPARPYLRIRHASCGVIVSPVWQRFSLGTGGLWLRSHSCYALHATLQRMHVGRSQTTMWSRSDTLIEVFACRWITALGLSVKTGLQLPFNGPICNHEFFMIRSQTHRPLKPFFGRRVACSSHRSASASDLQGSNSGSPYPSDSPRQLVVRITAMRGSVVAHLSCHLRSFTVSCGPVQMPSGAEARELNTWLLRRAATWHLSRSTLSIKRNESSTREPPRGVTDLPPSATKALSNTC